ncbi:agarase [Thalassotalea agariperforans]
MIIYKPTGSKPLIAATAICLIASCSGFKSNEDSLNKLKTEVPLFTFEDGKVPNTFSAENSSLQIVQGENALEGQHALKVGYNTKENNTAFFTISPESAFNWGDYKDFHIAFDVKNTGTESVAISLIMGDIDGGFYERGFVAPVDEKITVYAKMDGHDQYRPAWATPTEFNFESGFRSNPVTWESDDKQVYNFWGKIDLNTKGITYITLQTSGLLSDREFIIDNIRLRPNPKMNKNFLTGFIDKFGQNARAEYPSKIKSDEHLRQVALKELQDLNGEPMSDRSKFQGWKNGPRFEATGYFRTEKINGKWALIDPKGYLYFSTGTSIIRLSNSSTMTGYDFDQKYIPKRTADMTVAEDDQPLNPAPKEALPSRYVSSKLRADIFEWLPSYDDELGNHFGYRRDAQSGPLKRGETYSFYSANLERRYGETYPESYMDTWRSVTVRRMLDWGYTSLGNWSEQGYYGNNKIPFVAFADIIGEFGTVSSGFDFWHGVPDAYDPRFYERAVAAAKHVASQINASPWCMGIFMDNEQSFGRGPSDEGYFGIVYNTLQRDAKDVHAKAAFTQSMKKKYQTIDALNKAWDKNIASWDAFAAGIDSSFKTEQQRKDYSQLLYEYGVQYFGTVNKALKSELPNHLYLGSRLPEWGKPIEIVKAAAENSDIITYNIYQEGLAASEWDFLKEVDKPALVGEFSYGADDAGHVHPTFKIAADQEDRGHKVKRYFESIIDNPYFVGAHYFQYMDGPIAGRAYDGENYNAGMVSITDVPYEPMVRAVKQVNSDLYERRYGYLKSKK